MKIDIIGDIHGCLQEFKELTVALDYDWSSGLPIHKDRTLGFVGDLTDRGPNSLKVVDIVYELVKTQKSIYVPGNHCDKYYRFLIGRNVQQKHGLETTVAEYERLSAKQQEKAKEQFIWLYENSPLYAVLDNAKLVIAHAGMKDAYIGRTDKKVKTFVLYGDITGETHEDGFPVRRDWAKEHTGDTWIVYGHTPVKTPRFVNNTVNIDTGCIFGNKLTAIRYPEMSTLSVPSTMPYVEEKFRPI
ncbi:bis(5'-nucleosyl)-tetraphosphatase PrpE [Mangrovibacillus cuniculi]|uniref:Bis(5'-nucleosyl)-tetraphosphatase PrpE n=1 Tax=Mangrovibacillus cuniculi TaxID=2593652 RepID=A0A7S8C9W3_9BACI|nr:bis(5'-nucleosyl)-tetraphosphatase PrpE [Mangrovibacillus cuniculi]QPC46089.1 bis(5'-nucleosyl)-tetraphosphatase PrpE [Mangrovibacillus cuniculi]